MFMGLLGDIFCFSLSPFFYNPGEDKYSKLEEQHYLGVLFFVQSPFSGHTVF